MNCTENCNTGRNFTKHSQCEEIRHQERLEQSERHSIQEPTVKM